MKPDALQPKIFLTLHALVELTVAVLMVTGHMPAPYDSVFAEAHSVVRGFAGGGAAAIGVIGLLTLWNHIPTRVGLAFCGTYQLFIVGNEAFHETALFPGGLDEAGSHILFGIGPHLVLGVWGLLLAGLVRTANPSIPEAPSHPLLALVHEWAQRFGYYDGIIDLDIDDLRRFTTAGATLTAHAPLWGTKEGAEEAVPAAEVRRRLAGMLRWFRVERTNMHLAHHPTEDQLCLFFVVNARLPVLPIRIMTVPLAFVVCAASTSEGLRIESVDEYAAATPAEARRVLVQRCGWPDTTAMTPYVGFGATS